MITEFTEIFDEFLDTEIDSFDISKYSPPTLSKYLSNLLKRAREQVYNLLYKNSVIDINKMDDVVEFSNNEYDFSYTGITFTTTLNPIPILNSDFYITVDNQETNISDYIYDSTLGQITINNMTNALHSINIISYINGHFNQNLSLIEKGILVDWMGVFFLKDKIKSQRLYNITVYGVDYPEKSQANHLKALESIYNENKHDAEVKTLEYTYRNDPTNLHDLGARGGM